MDAPDEVGLRQIQQIVVASQRRRPVREALASDLGLGDASPLEHRAHGPIENENAVGNELAEAVESRHTACPEEGRPT